MPWLKISISRVIAISILLTVTVLHTYNCYLVETKMFFKLSLAILLSFGGGARGGGGGAIFLQQGQFGQSKVIIYISSWYILFPFTRVTAPMKYLTNYPLLSLPHHQLKQKRRISVQAWIWSWRKFQQQAKRIWRIASRNSMIKTSIH